MTRRDGRKAERLVVGAVSYLNTRPLVYHLRHFAPGVDLVFDLPSRLADGLAESRLDVALIPSIELLGREEYRVVSDACIACRGPVLSVKLLFRKPLPRIRTLALDEGSRTSGVLARILLKARHGLAPKLQPLPVNTPIETCRADALLVIGDRAIHPPVEEFVEQWDLGQQWWDWCGLPFVFAVWAGRDHSQLPELANALGKARDEGLSHLDSIASRHARGVGLSVEQTLHYLRDNLHFSLGSTEQRGLELFYERAGELGAVTTSRDLFCHDC